ncbi:MAG TPA: alcohol dehydrogenase catalytic domain-containing protein [Terriglobia bacterium]|nr:alcohol dehydrogenase catalytic domain-containing protein [Terriglobia bacterium]
MKAAVLEDVKKLRVGNVPDPELNARAVVLGVRAVGVCGTDHYIFQGHSNYRVDSKGRVIPLKEQPQILGHEFCGEVLETGREVRNVKVGDLVLCDQGLNCYSSGRWPLCPYCASGDSHQCAYYQEPGITGLPGAMAEYIAMPGVNCIPVTAEIPPEQVVMSEPLACIIHACKRVEAQPARYTLEGPERVRNILITGAGPAGLLFLQYLRNVRGFAGRILISDLREKNLEIAKQFGGTPINASRTALPEAVQELTQGGRIHYLIEASGSATVFKQIPGFLAKQATVLIYGLGHTGGSLELLSNILFLEPHLVSTIGASGGFDSSGSPVIYRQSLELISAGKIKVLPIITHRYAALEDVHKSFEEDHGKHDYIKGVMSLAPR